MIPAARSSTIDSAVVEQAGGSHARRFESFLREQRDALIRFLHRRTANWEDAEDMAQESLTRLLRYREPGTESDWTQLLYRIADNAAKDDSWRARDRREVSGETAEVALRGMTSPDPDIADQIHQQQELALIRKIILGLPPRCREVYALNRFEAMSYAQIARHLNISVKAVEKSMARALTALRDGVGR